MKHFRYPSADKLLVDPTLPLIWAVTVAVEVFVNAASVSVHSTTP